MDLARASSPLRARRRDTSRAHLDTGMSRLGLSTRELDRVVTDTAAFVDATRMTQGRRTSRSGGSGWQIPGQQQCCDDQTASLPDLDGSTSINAVAPVFVLIFVTAYGATFVNRMIPPERPARYVRNSSPQALTGLSCRGAGCMKGSDLALCFTAIPIRLFIKGSLHRCQIL